MNLFYANKHTDRYYRIIERARKRTLTGYVENHHVIPRSIGTDGDMVQLTAKEHYVCHLLLYKMVIEPKHKRAMAFAIWSMSGKSKNHTGRFTGAMYQILKLQWSNLNKGKNNPFYGKGHLVSGDRNHFFGKKHSQETIDKIKATCREKSLGSNNAFYGKKHSDETKAALSKFRSENKFASGPYRLIDPEGKEYIVREGIKTFCLDRGLVPANIMGAADRHRKTGRKYTSRGWTVESYETNSNNKN